MSVNPMIALAHDFLEYTGENIFLTGSAGTGKTTFLRHLRDNSPKRMIVVAPTGVAAINAGGVTMHSFFQLPFGVNLPGIKRASEQENRRFGKVKISIIKSLDLLVIDEISMVRADVLDNVDEVLRRYRDRNKPFGGVQLLMIGDMQQLAPVVRDEEWELLRGHYRSPYFFDSLALGKTSFTSIELKHIYRQSDKYFIGLLSQVRENRIDDRLIAALNERCRPDFDPPQSEGYITLTSHNHSARTINDRKLEAIDSPEYTYQAEVDGEFEQNIYPVDYDLRLKEGAQVMFAKNDVQPERRFVNGTIGTVTRLGDNYIEVLAAGAAEPTAVDKAEWENTRYAIDPQTRQIVEQIAGVYKQYPLKTAWAITIHKSQGLTFDRAVIDAADSFSHGQVYVALSRCRTLEGMVLRSPLTRRSIINDSTVEGFSQHVERNQPSERELEYSRQLYYETLLAELFDFKVLSAELRSTGRFVEENLYRTYPKLVERWKESYAQFTTEVFDVGLRFRAQIGKLMSPEYGSDPVLAERVIKGADYFLGKCTSLAVPLLEAAKVPVDNKELGKSLTDHLSRLGQSLRIKLSTLTAAQEGFDVKHHLEARAKAIVDAENQAKAKLKTPKPEKAPKAEKTDSSEDILVPELFEILREWRIGIARQLERPAYTIASTSALITIANTMPVSPKELGVVSGIGKVFMEKYGAIILKIIQEYRNGSIG